MRIKRNLAIIGVLVAAASAAAQTPAPKPTPNSRLLLPINPVAGYQPVVLPANIAPTAANPPATAAPVIGQAHEVKGHPCTLWDADDIAYYKELLKKNQPFQEQFKALRDAMDKRITGPLNVSESKKGPDGQWLWPGDLLPDTAPTGASNDGRYFKMNAMNSKDISQLGMAYALTGEAKYGEYCRKLILAYAGNYTKWGHPKGRGWGSAVDGRLTGQFLEDGGWLIHVAFGYDLIRNLPSFTPEDHAVIRDGLFKPIVAEFQSWRGGSDQIFYLNDPNNRSAIYAAATLLAGYSSEDPVLINDGLYGVGGTQNAPKPGSKDNPEGGVFGPFFSSKCITPDGLWAETIGYQTTIAGSAMIDMAEILWRHGIDMYRYKNSLLKRMFDSPIQYAYPDADMSLPMTGDTTARLPISSTIDAVIYQIAYLRYGDPAYVPIINRSKKEFAVSMHCAPPSRVFDPLPEQKVVRKLDSINFFDCGMGVLRLPADGRTDQLMLMFGPSRSHGHPDKLAVDYFAMGDVLMPIPGVIFPYNNPLDPTWFSTTLANSTMVVDEKTQVNYGAMYQYAKNQPPSVAPQLVFGPASTMAVQRAYTVTSSPGSTLDRAVFLTPEYFADVFGAFSDKPRKYDLAWHIQGEMKSDLKFDPMTFPEPVENGYNALSNVRHASTDKAWSAAFTRKDKTARFLAAGGTGTEIIVGNGHYRGDVGYSANDHKTLAILERRTTNSTIYGNVTDVSGLKDGYVKSITQEGGLVAGYGLLKLETEQGIDRCFVSYQPGNYKSGDFETDAQQAMVLADGKNVRAMYLAGGKVLKVGNASITRSEPGLAYVEKLADGTYVVGNPSPSKATITITLPALGGTKTLELAPEGKWTSGTAAAAH